MGPVDMLLVCRVADMLLVCRVEEGGAELFFAFPFLASFPRIL